MKLFDKYQTIRKRLDLQKPKTKSKRFLIIDIDALSHEILVNNMKKAGSEFLHRLLEKEGYHLAICCGIPSSTLRSRQG